MNAHSARIQEMTAPVDDHDDQSRAEHRRATASRSRQPLQQTAETIKED